MPAYTCPLPFVTVDPFTYKYSRIVNGPCAMPCPDPISTKAELIHRDRIFLGFTVPSTIMGVFLLTSYFFFPVLRERVFIIIAIASVQYQGIWLHIPFWHRIAEHGLGSGQSVGCRLSDAIVGPDGSLLSATPFTQSNFVCAMVGISGIYGMYASLGAVCSLATLLVQKVCLGINLTEPKKRLQQRIMIAICFVVPTIFTIVVLGYHQFNGGGNFCNVNKGRDSTSTVNLADGLTIIPAIVYVIYALVCGLWVILYLGYIKLKIKSEGHALTWAQGRILMMITVMCSIYIAIFTFRAQIEWKWAKPMGEAIVAWLFCTLTTPGDQATIVATCGEVAAVRIPPAWLDYLAYIGGSPAFTIFFAVGFSTDIIYCWAKYFYDMTGWPALKNLARKAPRAAGDKSYQLEPTRTAASQQSAGSRTAGGGSVAGSIQNGEPAGAAAAPRSLFKKTATRPGAGSVYSPRGDSVSMSTERDSFDSPPSMARPSNQPLFQSINIDANASVESAMSPSAVEMSPWPEQIREESVLAPGPDHFDLDAQQQETDEPQRSESPATEPRFLSHDNGNGGDVQYNGGDDEVNSRHSE